MENSPDHLGNGRADAEFRGALSTENHPSPGPPGGGNGLQVQFAIRVRLLFPELRQGLSRDADGGPGDHLALAVFPQDIGNDGLPVNTHCFGDRPPEPGGIQCGTGGEDLPGKPVQLVLEVVGNHVGGIGNT